jgi:hypothetical protein
MSNDEWPQVPAERDVANAHGESIRSIQFIRKPRSSISSSIDSSQTNGMIVSRSP